jgi:hypothetical protein
MGYINGLPVSESNPQSSSEYDSAKKECPQLVDFPSIFSSPLQSVPRSDEPIY